MFLEKGFLKICSRFTGENPCRSVISIKLLCKFIEITHWHGCSPVNLLHIFRAPFTKNTSGWLLLTYRISALHCPVSLLKSHQRCAVKSCFYKLGNINRKTPVFLIKLRAFRPAALLNRGSNTGVGDYGEVFKNNFIEEHLRTAASEVRISQK